jgi:hypothetical protein
MVKQHIFVLSHYMQKPSIGVRYATRICLLEPMFTICAIFKDMACINVLQSWHLISVRMNTNVLFHDCVNFRNFVFLD